MGFQTPQYELAEYLKWTTTGKIQLPDFQRGYKWEDERIRELLVTILRGHPLGVVMLLQSGNDQVRFKPRAVEGVVLPDKVEAQWLLLDGQQRLTSLTQALTGSGVVATKDDRGKLLDRRYYVDIELAMQGSHRMDEAVFSVPGDGIVRENFGKDVVRDLSTEERERDERCFPLRLLFADAVTWLFAMDDTSLAAAFHAAVIKPTNTYNIPAIELDKETTKEAVATVFEKVNTGGLPLNAFELLTAVFAGDKAYYDQHREDFRLNDDWVKTKTEFATHNVLGVVESIDFLQAICLLTTLARANAHHGPGKPPAVSARREDVLTLGLEDYLAWVDPLRAAYAWCATFLADLHIFDRKFLPYAKQLVPLAAIKVLLGDQADHYVVRDRLAQWFWCGVLGELYGGSIETRFARDVEQVPAWASSGAGREPGTLRDFGFRSSRLLSLRTRNAAAYKGIYALVIGQGAKDWWYDQAFDKAQYATLATDIHHVFPYKWCVDEGIDPTLRESVVNKTPLSAKTNRAIGGAAPSSYLETIQRRADLSPNDLNGLLESHLIDTDALRTDDFDAFFAIRLGSIVGLIEGVTGKSVQEDVFGTEFESADEFDPEDVSVVPDLDDIAS